MSDKAEEKKPAMIPLPLSFFARKNALKGIHWIHIVEAGIEEYERRLGIHPCKK